MFDSIVEAGSRVLTALAVILAAPSLSPGEEPKPDAKGVAFFEAKIRPVLVANCYACHSAEAKKSEGGLLLDTRAGIRAGGDRGPAVVPGDVKASVLLTAISHADSDLKMPPKKDKLPDSVQADIREWIKMGAPDTRDGDNATAIRSAVDLESARRFWSYIKPVASEPPATKDPGWAKRDLDHFVLAKLEAAKLGPSPDAAPATLLRRLHFDLVGLPPSPAALREFLKAVNSEGLDKAMAAEVDGLLASPRFGERWGRHWLDVARFAESSGKEANISFPYAFRYRDYVFDCVNADLPYDRFLVEQIAGDLLPADDDKERARLLIATGFLAVGPKNLDEGDLRQFTADVYDEQVDAVTRAVTANSVACARCHDHKFEPYSMEDYYGLVGVFASSRTYFGTAVSPSNRIGGDPLVLPAGAGLKALHPGVSAEQVKKLKEQLADLKKQKIVTLTDALRVFWTSGGIEGQLEKVDENGAPLVLAMGVTEGAKIVDAPLNVGGDVHKLGQPVPRGFPRIVSIPSVAAPSSDKSGRLEFAHWLTHPDHPLTARVFVNRVWRHLFGSGLVATSDNFGPSGERPSHPELLDLMAVRFVENGWSLKHVVREIALSRTYRQASTYRAAAFHTDPENRLLWRATKRRLDAEAIRDAMLAASGELDVSRPAGSLVATKIGDRPISLIGLDASLPADLDGSLHRSVYLPVLRDRLPDALDLFDFAEPSLVTGDRETTNVPVQALYLMNGPWVHARAKALGEKLLLTCGDASKRLRRAFLLCYGRPPDAEEKKTAEEYLANGSGDAADSEAKTWARLCQALMSTAEFRNLD